LNFFSGAFFSGGFFGESEPVVAKQGGAGKVKRRRWQAEKEGRVYEFDSAVEAQSFLQNLVVAEQKKLSNKKRKFRLPDVEIFYDDVRVTNLEIESKPVIEWFYGPDLETLENIMAAFDEDDIEVLLLVT
jgi:hypothetical protein